MLFIGLYILMNRHGRKKLYTLSKMSVLNLRSFYCFNKFFQTFFRGEITCARFGCSLVRFELTAFKIRNRFSQSVNGVIAENTRIVAVQNFFNTAAARRNYGYTERHRFNGRKAERFVERGADIRLGAFHKRIRVFGISRKKNAFSGADAFDTFRNRLSACAVADDDKPHPVVRRNRFNEPVKAFNILKTPDGNIKVAVKRA